MPIIAAGGGPDGSLGTDGDRIAAAIAEAGAGGGAIVLMDMGSAVLSVKGALADADGVRAEMADAPLVEGAVAAAVVASGGAPLETVVAAARRRAMSASSEPAETTATLPGDVALHARPAGVVSREAMQFSARLTLVFGDRKADAKSVLRVMALGAEPGQP